MPDVTERDRMVARGLVCARCRLRVSHPHNPWTHNDDETSRGYPCLALDRNRVAEGPVLTAAAERIAAALATARAEGYAAGRASVEAVVCPRCKGCRTRCTWPTEQVLECWLDCPSCSSSAPCPTCDGAGAVLREVER